MLWHTLISFPVQAAHKANANGGGHDNPSVLYLWNVMSESYYINLILDCTALFHVKLNWTLLYKDLIKIYNFNLTHFLIQ
jgi:hypothetical protein